MMMTRTIVMWTAALCLTGGVASAQTVGAPDTKYFVDVNLGMQLIRHDVTATNTFPLYDETAVISGTQRTAHGFFVDVGAGYKFKPNLAAALSFSSFSSKT